MSHVSIEQRVDQLQAGGIIDMHFDLPMDLYEKRAQSNVLATEFLPEFEAGGMGLIGAAIYIEDRYLPERGLQVALDQIARLYTEAEQSKRCVICRSHAEISRALDSKKTGFLITLEGVEPLGDDLDLLRTFYELGVRVIGLTHARTNAAGHGGIFAASGSSPEAAIWFASASDSASLSTLPTSIRPASRRLSISRPSHSLFRTRTPENFMTSSATSATNRSK